MTTATKTKSKKIGHLYAPAEIRENTKARRAWLAAKVEEINAQPNRMAKIVGTGCLQEVSIYEVTEVVGRLRLRGVCQYCGNSQVSENGVLVLHGYKRPGDGTTYGRCPGMNKPALQLSNVLTTEWHRQFAGTVAELQAEVEASETRRAAALVALYPGNDARVEDGAHRARPSAPRQRDAERNPELVKQYMAAKVEWAKQFPLSAEYEAAEAALRHTKHTLWQNENMLRHFAALLALNLTGTELTKEVVA